MWARNRATRAFSGPRQTYADIFAAQTTSSDTGACRSLEEGYSTMVYLDATTRANLIMQGFGYLDEEEQARCARALRFTPAVGTALVVAGLLRQSPSWLAMVSVIALSGALIPSGMVIDLIYNLGVRHLVGAPQLPATPAPRRFSYLISAALLAGAALSFANGLTAFGWILGGLVAIGGTILTLSLWCLGSWIFHTGILSLAAIRSKLAGVLR